MPSSPVSDLSALNSDDFDEDMPASRSDNGTDTLDDNDSSAIMPPSKRRRVTFARHSSNHDDAAANLTGGSNAEEEEDEDDASDTDVSSDSSGLTAGGSPWQWRDMGMQATEWEMGDEQIRVCTWDGCEAGDLGDQDELVRHINDVHVADSKQKFFVCEWSDCRAKGKPQMSAYALRAHLRSHTKEKPFFCSLPECDRSFTRSDALAKHMRTVHEAEPASTSEFYAIKIRSNIANFTKQPNKGKEGENETNGNDSSKATPSTSSKPPQRLKLVFNKDKSSAPQTPQHNGTADSTDSDYPTGAPPTPLSPSTRDNLFGALPDNLQFTKEEAAIPRRDLFRLLRRQTHWAQKESESLQQQILELEENRRKEWLSKELVLENVLEAEFAGASKRGMLDDEGPDSFFGELALNDWGDNVIGAEEKDRIYTAIETDARESGALPLKGPGSTPWYRAPGFEAKRKLKESVEAGDGESVQGSEGEGEGEGEADESLNSDDVAKDAPRRGSVKAAPEVAIAGEDGDETEEDK